MTVVLVLGQIPPFQRPEKFHKTPREFKTIDGFQRIWPNPKWIANSWLPKEDEPFLKIQSEVTKALESNLGFSEGNEWTCKFRRAYDEYFADYQNPVKLFRASAYYGVATSLEPDHMRNDEIGKMWLNMNAGWDYLRNPPKSYLFARRGYVANVGEGDNHLFGDLGSRLLKRDPRDKFVVLAMGYEYRDRSDRAFEDKVFRLLKEFRNKNGWRPWDDYRYAWALQFKALRHKDLRILGQCEELAKSAKEKTPSYVQPKPMDELLERLPFYRSLIEGK